MPTRLQPSLWRTLVIDAESAIGGFHLVRPPDRKAENVTDWRAAPPRSETKL